MNENLEAHILAGIGLARGVAQEIKSEITIERIETAGLVIGIGGLVLAAYELYTGSKK